MIGTRMIRVAPKDRFEHGDDFFGVFGRLAVGAPQGPGMKVHHALGVDRRGIEVVRILFGDLAHRVFESDLQRFEIGFRVERVAVGQRENISPFVGRGVTGEADGQLRFFVSRRFAFGVDVDVDVRPKGIAYAPVSHRQVRVECQRAFEGADGGVVVEPVDETQALVEEVLGHRVRGGDRVMPLANFGEEFDGLLGFLAARIGRAGTHGDEDCANHESTAVF
jgi:hypothetical protein